MAHYKLAPSAEEDLERIWLYGLGKWGLAKANSYIETMHRRFDELAENPLHYPAVSDIYPGYRRSVCGSDSIYYRVNGHSVEIMAIIGKQDLEPCL
ncbi:MAG: type II toxin-antitoxin system RelE/ParE family toxin [Cellvibrionaceae bacterium]|nr:type II toxin-antitoxin system RelE/ParE family toxin [Cellvibrionaceae bacterium]